jgi:hypothetical protein
MLFIAHNLIIYTFIIFQTVESCHLHDRSQDSDSGCADVSNTDSSQGSNEDGEDKRHSLAGEPNIKTAGGGSSHKLAGRSCGSQSNSHNYHQQRPTNSTTNHMIGRTASFQPLTASNQNRPKPNPPVRSQSYSYPCNLEPSLLPNSSHRHFNNTAYQQQPYKAEDGKSHTNGVSQSFEQPYNNKPYLDISNPSSASPPSMHPIYTIFEGPSDSSVENVYGDTGLVAYV